MANDTRDNKFLGYLNLDVSNIVEADFKGLSYISWANAYSILMSQDPEASFEVLEGDDGMPYFQRGETYFVKTSVTMFGVTKKMFLPIMDNNHYAVRSQPYKVPTKRGEVTVEALDSRNINDSIMRCLVKNIALFGIGLSLYVKNHDGLEAILNLDEITPVQQFTAKNETPAPAPQPAAPAPEPQTPAASPKASSGKGKAKSTSPASIPIPPPVILPSEPEPSIEDQMGEDDLPNMLAIITAKAITAGVKKAQIVARIKAKNPKFTTFEDMSLAEAQETLKALLTFVPAPVAKQEAAKITFQ